MSMSMSNVNLKKTFLSSPNFAVIGASTNPLKFGTKILKWYIDRGRSVTPVHPSEKELLGLPTVPSIAHLQRPTETVISVVTPPKVTISILEQAKSFGVPMLWLQPGAADDAVRTWIAENGWESRIIHDGPCILTDGDGVIKSML